VAFQDVLNQPANTRTMTVNMTRTNKGCWNRNMSHLCKSPIGDAYRYRNVRSCDHIQAPTYKNSIHRNHLCPLPLHKVPISIEEARQVVALKLWWWRRTVGCICNPSHSRGMAGRLTPAVEWADRWSPLSWPATHPDRASSMWEQQAP